MWSPLLPSTSDEEGVVEPPVEDQPRTSLEPVVDDEEADAVVDAIEDVNEEINRETASRSMFTHEEYIDLVRSTGQSISHDYR